MQISQANPPRFALERLRTLWHSFRIAAWLGWQIESNWADPFLFAVYSLVKPLAGAAILVVSHDAAFLASACGRILAMEAEDVE